MKIKGYRELSDYEITMINNTKEMADLVGRLVDIADQDRNTNKRWVDFAKADLQKGFMCLVRAWAKPESF